MRKWGLVIFLLLLVTRCNDEKMEPASKEPGKNHQVGAGNELTISRKDPGTPLAEFSQPKRQKVKIRARKKITGNNILPAEKTPEIRRIDTARIRKMRDLQRLNEEIDFSEPASRDYLYGDLTYPGERPFTLVSHEKFLIINFDNDILDNTDHFFTNGIRIELVSPGLRHFPLNFFMVPYWRPGINYYGLALVQNMYTPSTTKTGGILYGDRPYSGYLCLAISKITNDPVKKFRQTTELDIGVIGPLSGGEFVQSTFHKAVPTNNEPLGWQYQIQNDVVLNYSLLYEKGLVSLPAFDLNLNGTGNLGTLYTNFSGGLSMRTGLMNRYFSRLLVSDQNINQFLDSKNIQVFFFLKASGSVIGYDATLQGGLFNRSSVYTIDKNDLSRFMFNGSTGITFSYGGIRIDLEQFLISPEFRNGWWHKWVHIGLIFCL